MDQIRRVPWLTTIVSLAMVLLGLSVAFSAFTNPAGFAAAAGGDGPTAVGRAYAFAMASRSFTMAVALLLAWLLRTPRGLVAVLVMRALTETLDLVHALQMPGVNVAGAVGFVGVMIVAEAAAAVQMWRLAQRPVTPVAASTY